MSLIDQPPAKSKHRDAHDWWVGKPPSEIWRRVVVKMLKSAVFAFLARVLVGMLRRLFARKFAPAVLFRGLVDEALSENPIKWACTAAGFVSYRAWYSALYSVYTKTPSQLITSHKPSAPVALAAGALASIPGFVLNVYTRTELGLYLASRVAHGALNTYLFPLMPESWQKWKYWDIVAMSMSASQILYAMLAAPNTHLPDYQNFLVSNSRQDRRALYNMGSMHLANVVSPSIYDLCRERNIAPPVNGKDLAFICRELHPWTPWCSIAKMQWMVRHFFTFSLKFYFPLRTTMLLLYGRKRLIADPKGTLYRLAENVLCASAFLTTYCAAGSYMVCVFNSLGVTNHIALRACAGAAAGSALLLEQPERRLDYVLYCNIHGFRSLYLDLVQNGYLSRPNFRHIAVMYVASLALMLQQFEVTPNDVHPSLLSPLAWALQEDAPTTTQEKPARGVDDDEQRQQISN